MQQQIGLVESHRSRPSRSSRSPSVSTDSGPPPSVSTLRSVPTTTPLPAYIAAAAAAELVTNNHHSALNEDAYNSASPPSPNEHDKAQFSIGALAMVNAFLDQLLFNFLFHSRGTTLAALRQSVEQVLKGKLATYAIASAVEELEELLNDDDLDESLAAVQESASGDTKGDTEAVFWRTRLRIMVYMRLGELEDEDEEHYVEQAQAVLHKDAATKRISLHTGLVSWAAAIFLTSILEYIAEQCLVVAAQATYGRAATKKKRGDASVDEEEPLTIEEHDVEKIALSSTLGRLWRTWRKGLRVPHSRTASGHKSNPGSRIPSVSAIRQELASGASAESHSREMSETAFENSLLNRPGVFGGETIPRRDRGFLPSDEGARVNAVRIYRISQRPRSLMIEPTKRLEPPRDPGGLLEPPNEQAGSLRRARSSSLPSFRREEHTSHHDVSLPYIERPRTASKFQQSAFSDPQMNELSTHSQSEPNGVPEHQQSTEVPDDFEIEPEHQSPTESGQSELSFLERAVATRRPVQTTRDSKSISSEDALPHTAAHASTTSQESFTSVEESFRPTVGNLSRPTEKPRFIANGLGIQPVNQSPSAYFTNNAALPPRSDSRLPRKALARPTITTGPAPYHEQQVTGPEQSFDREEKSSLRRLSNSSSKTSKSISLVKVHDPAKTSLDTSGSPQSAATGRSAHFEKDFGDLMAGQETVKYTLTPRALQQIESPGTSETDFAGNNNSYRNRKASDPEFSAAQKAVIASMNASLKNFSLPASTRVDKASPVRAVSSPSPHPPVPSLPRSLMAEREPPLPPDVDVQRMQNGTESAATYGENERPRGGSLSQVSPKYPPSAARANQPNGWFSSRTSIESSRSSKTNGTGSLKAPQSPLTPKKSNPLLQPREAIIGRKGDSDDLIAFLKSTGPPGVQVYRGPSAQSGDANTISSTARTSSLITPSVHGSTNSQVGLLPTAGSGRSYAGRSGLGSMADEGRGPARTRHRIKDPYALPSDDDEEDELTALPTSRSETLVDFLRNVDPPSSTSGANGHASSNQGGLRDARHMNGDASDFSSPSARIAAQKRTIKGKTNNKPFWKKIGA